MKITSAKFVRSVGDLSQLPKEGLLEVAFAGRSNVGKSRLINCLVNRRKLAEISSTPGKTRLLNYYLINEKFYFVDLPGYGFAKVSEGMRRNWRRLIESFLTGSPRLRGVVLIIDSRHDLTVADQEMIRWLKSLQLPVIIAATKSDKLSGNRLSIQLAKFREEMGHLGGGEVILFSAITGVGKRELWQKIGEFLEKK